MNYQIAIPSYRRADMLRDTTLCLLKVLGVARTRITIFVANKAEKKEYEEKINPKYYSDIVIAKPGMRAVRNFIQDYYEEGERVVCVDDDIKDIRYKVDDKTTKQIPSFDQIVQRGFAACESAKATLWGIYPVMNPMFMKATIHTDLKYIIGCLWGYINNHDKSTYVTLDDKEDYERSILYYMRDGAVVRLNYIAPVTNYYNNPGGMQVERTEERVTKSANHLAEKYPMYCKLNLKKKSGHAELRLKDSTKGLF